MTTRTTRTVTPYSELVGGLFGGMPGFGILISRHLSLIDNEMQREHERQGQANAFLYSKTTALSIFAEKENARQRTVASLIATTYNFTATLAHLIESLLPTTNREVETIMILFRELTKFTVQLNHLHEIKEGLLSIKNHQITSDILPPELVVEAIRTIESELKSRKAPSA